MKVVTKAAKWPVTLACGHDKLTSEGNWFAGTDRCRTCGTVQRIVFTYTLRERRCTRACT